MLSPGSGPYLFDVGPIALAHAGTPVSETALEYIRPAIQGEVTAIVPYPAVVGAHHVLRGTYYLKNRTASELMQNFIESTNIYWYNEFSYDILNNSFEYSTIYNIEGWDGYFAQVAEESGASAIVTVDERFENLDHIRAELILSEKEKEVLNEFLEDIEEADDLGSRFE
ncbi:type II toxin-antitoxin system VapC family toxin [Halobellus rubicundus]|uniref:Type II toxin-antitoxin system VapC family toxin n=1 Tax=Halobellus rubicundus TaxID=2996466 RepID=A0ABD5MK93_9EURY